MSCRRYCFSLLAFMIFVLSPLSGFALQDMVPTPTPTPPPELSSARATMSTFLGAFYAEGGVDLDRAAGCLDLSELPRGLRKPMGQELALQLKRVLDRSEYIDVSKISDRSDGAPWILKVGRDGEVVLSKTGNGRWLFSRETVKDLSRLERLVESKKVVKGVVKTVADQSVGMWIRQRIPAGLRGQHLFLESWQWIGLAGLLVLGFLLNKIFLLIALGPALRFLRLRYREVEDERVRYLLRPVGTLVMVLLWWFGLRWLGLPVSFLAWYASVVQIALVLVACVTAYRLVDVVSGVLLRRAAETTSRFDDLLVPLVSKSLKIMIVIVGTVLIFQAFGQDLKALLAGLGIGGLALALAAQDTIGNLFGSLTVVLDRPFQVGDWVKIGDVEGTVEEVGFRSTRVRTFYDSLISLPNSHLTKASVDNLGQRKFRRWTTRLALVYDTPPGKVEAFCEGVRELIRRDPQTRKDMFHVYFNEFGGSSLEVMLYLFFEVPDWSAELKARHRLAVNILRLAAALKVDFAFPTQTLYVRQDAWEPAQPLTEAGELGVQSFLDEGKRAAAEISKMRSKEKVAGQDKS